MPSPSALPDPAAEVVATFVGRPRTIGHGRGRPAESAIAKTRADAPAVQLGHAYLEGDRQADLSVHGTVPTAGSLVLEHRDGDAPTVLDTFAVMFDAAGDDDGEALERVLAAPPLAQDWRAPLAARRHEARA